MTETWESQGERRRRQLISVTCELISEEGIDAVRVPTVAERAGVGRTAVYRYFPDREDLLAAVEEDFHRRLTERLDGVELEVGLAALAEQPANARIAPATEQLFAAIWDTVVERGPAGPLLRARAMAESDDATLPDRFAEALVRMGLGTLEATLFSDSANAIITRLYFRAERGALSRSEALGIGHAALVGLLAGLRARA